MMQVFRSLDGNLEVHLEGNSEKFELETREALSEISRALSLCNPGGWISFAAKIRMDCTILGLDRLADRCMQLEKINDVEYKAAAELVFEGISREFALVCESLRCSTRAS